MRLTYLCIPLFALLLAGCGDDEPNRPVDTTVPDAPADEAFGTPVDPADDVLPPNNGNMPPPTTPQPDDGLGTEYGTQPGSTPPAGDGAGNTP
ncbi:hypothetical protein [Halopseudomonas xiamenensis]|uniref:hypothetical protein n=1 Tax=Halopseudomonas xiamenensis TaxID=157792 RepID=UPI0016288767|nr:hypothetical protein [Halopseudomonas xiamenensis]